MNEETKNKPVQLRTGNVITLGNASEQEGKAVWPVDMDILTGVPLFNSEMGGDNGWFIIDLETVVFHKPRLTMDYNHNENEIIGYVEGFEVDENGLHATGSIVPFDDKDRASEIIYKNKNGVPYEVSPTVLPYAAEVEDLADGETAVVNGTEQNGPIRIYRKLPVRGAAICPYGTDRHTNATVLSEKGAVMAKSKGKLSEDKIIDDANNTPPIDEETLDDEQTTSAHPDLEEMIAEFGEAAGLRYYREGISFEDAQKNEYAELKAAKMAKLQEEEKPVDESTPPAPGTDPEPPKKDDPEKAGLKAEIAKLNEKVDRLTKSMPRGEREPVSLTDAKPSQKKPDNRPAILKLADKYSSKM